MAEMETLSGEKVEGYLQTIDASAVTITAVIYHSSLTEATGKHRALRQDLKMLHQDVF
jgi:hypothetical protein